MAPDALAFALVVGIVASIEKIRGPDPFVRGVVGGDGMDCLLVAIAMGKIPLDADAIPSGGDLVDPVVDTLLTRWQSITVDPERCQCIVRKRGCRKLGRILLVITTKSRP